MYYKTQVPESVSMQTIYQVQLLTCLA